MVDTVMGRRGFTVPFYAVAVGANGGLLHMRVDTNEEGLTAAQLLAEHFEPKGFRVPVHFLFVDSQGAMPAVFRISEEDAPPESLKYVQ